jgi:hypothetical protein
MKVGVPVSPRLRPVSGIQLVGLFFLVANLWQVHSIMGPETSCQGYRDDNLVGHFVYLPAGKEVHMEFSGVVARYIIDGQVLGEGGDGEAKFSVVWKWRGTELTDENGEDGGEEEEEEHFSPTTAPIEWTAEMQGQWLKENLWYRDYREDDHSRG